MTTLWLIILRIVCGIQLILAVFQSFMSLTGLLLDGKIIFLLQAIAFAFIAMLPVLALMIISANHPDKPFTENRKRNFNRLFIINFILIAFLSGFVVKDYKEAQTLASQFRLSILGFIFDSNLLFSVSMILFHFVILYGLVWLRRTISKNANGKQFDFEMNDENV